MFACCLQREETISVQNFWVSFDEQFGHLTDLKSILQEIQLAEENSNCFESFRQVFGHLLLLQRSYIRSK